ncbi:MAG TPA: hypothetical protein VJQ54_00480 [Candidatus Sulfotelmatobacter sp.]|nr:hypothetical protein [Candidatus Sulfotelmatobacter sp.]
MLETRLYGPWRQNVYATESPRVCGKWGALVILPADLAGPGSSGIFPGERGIDRKIFAFKYFDNGYRNVQTDMSGCAVRNGLLQR